MTPPSIILIESRQPDNTAIGTGFVIHHTANNTYILTCAHVVRDMGGPDQVKAATLPAKGVDQNLPPPPPDPRASASPQGHQY